MRVIGWRRRKHDFQLTRAGLHFSPQARRQSSVDDQLALESGGQAIALGQTGRQAGVVRAVPVIDVAVAILVVAVTVAMSVALAMAVTMAMTFVAILVVSAVVIIATVFIVTVAVALGDSDSG